jgi:hypothetical protein
MLKALWIAFAIAVAIVFGIGHHAHAQGYDTKIIPQVPKRGVPNSVAAPILPRSIAEPPNSVDFFLICKPNPIPQSQADRDPVTTIEINWEHNYYNNTNPTFSVRHFRYSGGASYRERQYRDLYFWNPPGFTGSESGDWENWEFRWAGTNVVAPNMYIVGFIRLEHYVDNPTNEPDKNDHWVYQEYAKKFSDPKYQELITEAGCTSPNPGPH